MAEERKAPQRHPATAIPTETVQEISYQTWLRRLEPPMTPEQARAFVGYEGKKGQIRVDEAVLRKRSAGMDSLTRDYLRVLVDLGLIKPPTP